MIDRDLQWLLGGVPDGWTNLITTLYLQLQHLPVNIHIYDLKPKFGDLRFHYAFVDEPTPAMRVAVTELVNNAVVASYQTCERCGSYGVRRSDNHWIKTLCDNCKEVWQQERLTRWAK